MIIYFEVDTTSLLNMQRVPHKTYVGQEIVNIFLKSNGADQLEMVRRGV